MKIAFSLSLSFDQGCHLDGVEVAEVAGEPMAPLSLSGRPETRGTLGASDELILS